MAVDMKATESIPARLMLEDLPASPGVYLYRDRSGRVIYVGKAKSLRSRVRSYFQGASGGEPKTDELLAEIQGLEYIVTRLRGQGVPAKFHDPTHSWHQRSGPAAVPPPKN